MDYTVTENQMLATIIAVLKQDGKTELANILSVSKFNYDPQWEFSGIVSYQRKLYSNLKVPISFRKEVETHLKEISNIACDIYEDDDAYYYLGINRVGALAINLEEIAYEERKVIVEQNSVFTSFMKYLVGSDDISEIQKKYLFEACENGYADNMLSATVMLGCSAELLLLELSLAFYEFLKMNGTQAEQEQFEQKVIKAKVASVRLSELMKRFEARPKVFEKYGFENVSLNFNFLDIIRQTRNDSGHPTGNIISKGQFEMMLANYQACLPKALRAVRELPEEVVT
ncbi:hypothetical protein [Ferviditalea candida]|uniref:Uncharacterized protein n=1 Tax=Ferviditalea candida TaxID=3108399 RepID=A0ABU5ZMV4_9BACL|nr:hypothetical protein [Paenibacillaceae bacterium T2]